VNTAASVVVAVVEVVVSATTRATRPNSDSVFLKIHMYKELNRLESMQLTMNRRLQSMVLNTLTIEDAILDVSNIFPNSHSPDRAAYFDLARYEGSGIRILQ
jgi:hypothetical protein